MAIWKLQRLLFWNLVDERTMTVMETTAEMRVYGGVIYRTPNHKHFPSASSGAYSHSSTCWLWVVSTMLSTSRKRMDGEMERPLQEHSLPILDTEVSSSDLGNGSPGAGGDPPTDLEKSESNRIKNFCTLVLSAVMVFITVALSHFKDMKPLYSTTGHKETHLSNLLVAGGLLVFMTFMCAVVLVMVEIFVSSKHSRRCRAWYRVLTVLVAVTGTLLILADTVLVVVTNKSNMVLAVILAPVMVLVTVLTRAGAWMSEQPTTSSTLASSSMAGRSSTPGSSSTPGNSSTPDSSSTPGSRYDLAMKSASDMAVAGTIASFTLQGTVIFGYLRTPGAGGNQDPPLDLAACYTTSTVSLVVMMVCAMPLRLLPDGMLDILVMIVEKLRLAMLVALAMMALVVSVEFLDGFVVLSFFPEAVAILLYYAAKFFSARQPREENSPLDAIFRMVTTGGFTLMTGLYAAFVGIDNYDFYLKTAMFVLLLAILSSLSRLAIPLHIPEMGGAVEICIARVALAFPLLAFLVACPLVLKVFLNLYLNR